MAMRRFSLRVRPWPALVKALDMVTHRLPASGTSGGLCLVNSPDISVFLLCLRLERLATISQFGNLGECGYHPKKGRIARKKGD
jgi:hypothetical protein